MEALPKELKVTYVTVGINDSLVKQAMLQLISTYYDNRADFTTEQERCRRNTNINKTNFDVL